MREMRMNSDRWMNRDLDLVFYGLIASDIDS